MLTPKDSLRRGVSANLHQKKSKKKIRETTALSGPWNLATSTCDLPIWMDARKRWLSPIVYTVNVVCTYQHDLGRLLETVNVAIDLYNSRTCHLHAAGFIYGYAALSYGPFYPLYRL